LIAYFKRLFTKKQKEPETKPSYERFKYNGMGDRSSDTKISLDSAFNSPAVYPQSLDGWYSTYSATISPHQCASIAAHPEITKAITIPADDAIRQGWDLNFDDLSDNLEDKFDAITTKQNLKRLMRDHLISVRTFGVAYLLPIYHIYTKSEGGTEIARDTKEEKSIYESQCDLNYLNEKGAKLVKFVNVNVPDMTAVILNNNDPLGDDYLAPSYYYYKNLKVHASHIIRTIAEPNQINLGTENYSVHSIPLKLRDCVYQAESVISETVKLCKTKRMQIAGLSADEFHTLINNPCGQASLLERATFDNHSIMFMPLEDDGTLKYMQHNMMLSDLPPLISKYQEIIAQRVNIPISKFLGVAPAGLSSTGEFDMKNYSQMLESMQEHLILPVLNRIYEIIASKLNCSTPKIAFAPVDSYTAKELAEINKLEAEVGKILVESGVIAQDEERDRLKNDKKSGYTNLADVEYAETDVI
jgi:phage-related protein (TIGR01555 family)